MLQRIFGKKQVGVSPAQDDGTVVLKMDKVRDYAIALASRRGFPADSHGMIANRVVFLERRGLPGLIALYEEVATAKHSFADRAAQSRELAGGHCPIIAGVELNVVANELTTAEEVDTKWIVAPSNPMLLIPKIAEWVRPTGRLVLVSWAVDRQVSAQTAIDGFRIAHAGPLPPLRYAQHIGFCRYPEETLPPPKLTSGFLEEVAYAKAVVEAMDLYMVTSR